MFAVVVVKSQWRTLAFLPEASTPSLKVMPPLTPANKLNTSPSSKANPTQTKPFFINSQENQLIQ